MKKLKSTRDLRVNDVIRVYRKGFGYATLSVIDVHEEFLSAKAGRDLIESARQGDVLDAYYWSERNSSYEFSLEVLGVFSIDLNIIFFRHTGKIAWSRERKCLQADVDMPFSFFFFDVGDSQRVFTSKKVKLKNGKIFRLSDREAHFRYRGSLDRGTFVKGRLSLGGEDIDVVGRIECSREANGNNCVIRFSGMAGKERERILDYIFTTYRE